MARTRQIKPAFFKNELLAECDVFARLLFIGMWTLADKEGRLEDRPLRIKAELFPYDNVNINDLLSSLDEKGFIRRYKVSNQSIIQILNFVKHQHIHGKEQDSELPEYKEEYNLPGKSRESTGQEPDLPPLTTLNPIPNYLTTLNPIPKPKPKTSSDEIFEEAWKIYPKQRIGSKPNAMKAWNLAISRNHTEEQILQGVINYGRSNEVTRGFAKGFAAWLNDDRFINDYSVEIQNGTNNRRNSGFDAFSSAASKVSNSEQPSIQGFHQHLPRTGMLGITSRGEGDVLGCDEDANPF